MKNELTRSRKSTITETHPAVNETLANHFSNTLSLLGYGVVNLRYTTEAAIIVPFPLCIKKGAWESA